VAIRDSTDPALFTVLLEDSAAVAGIAIAFGSTLASQFLDEPRFDGAGSILIGLLLAAVAGELAHKCKGLLIGERADEALRMDLKRIARDCPAVEHENGIITVQLAPDQVVAAFSLEFRRGLSTREIELAVDDMQIQLRRSQPKVRYLFVKPQSRASFIRTTAYRRRRPADR
jgi:divalent metal cation (Fe/Co/Zn/Cd) transporter